MPITCILSPLKLATWLAEICSSLCGLYKLFSVYLCTFICSTIVCSCKATGKGKVLSSTGHEAPEVEQTYSSTLSLTSALAGGGWSTPRPGRFTPRKDPVPNVYETAWVAGPVWTGVENLAPIGIRSPDPPARSESLHRLSCHPGSHCM